MTVTDGRGKNNNFPNDTSMGNSSITNTTINNKKKSPHKLLLVDDDESTLLSIKMYFEDKTELRVDTFSNPLEALTAFRAELYDLLIIDVMMPQMNGFKFYQEIIKKANNINVKACFITANETYYEKLKKEFPQLDVGCFISKPIKLSKLVEKIKEELQSQL